MSREIDAMVASSNFLLNLQQLSKVQRQAPPLPRVGAVPMHLDDRFFSGAVLTKARRSVLPPEAVNRMASEFYPVAPPRVDFFPGEQSRLIGRDARPVYERDA